MKLKKLTALLVLCFVLLTVGCTKNTEISNSDTQTNTNINSESNSDNNQPNNTGNSTDVNNSNNETNSDKNNSSVNTNTNNNQTNNNSNNNNTTNTDNTKTLANIKSQGLNGANIYCNNVKVEANIDDVVKIYGEATESNYVSSAKGIYYNYKSNNFAFGCNKGDQIFEIRSYDSRLKNISLSDVQSYFGNADYESNTSVGEKLMGYKISDKYKLLFVFDGDVLDHYSVFCPELTANYMANDPGREW